MNNIYLLAGEELYLKDKRIREILNCTDDYELEIYHVDSYKNESYNQIANHINIFLSTYDFFSSTKAIRLVISKPSQVNPILSRIDDFDIDNKLIVDLRCPEYSIRNMKFEYSGKVVSIERFFEFKDYEEDKVRNYIKQCFNDSKINFESDYDLELSTSYLLENSLNSYSFIHQQINKIALLNKNVFKYEDITFVSGGLPDKNSYRICDCFFKSTNIKDAIEYLDHTLYTSDYTMFLTLINTLVGKLHDYILLNDGKMCKVKANYYTFKNSKIKILECNKFIIKLNNLAMKSKKSKEIFKEEFLILILEHLYIENI